MVTTAPPPTDSTIPTWLAAPPTVKRMRSPGRGDPVHRQPPFAARALPSIAEHSFSHGSLGKPAAMRQALAKLPHHGLPTAVPVARFQRSIIAPRLVEGGLSTTPRCLRA